MEETFNNHKQSHALYTWHVVCSASKRRPWNWGKRKPVEDDCGNKWCNCIEPKLTSNAGGRGQAYCLLCHTPWYH